jgi:hypothetical protein
VKICQLLCQFYIEFATFGTEIISCSINKGHGADKYAQFSELFLKDLLNFEDPLNIEAAEMYLRDKEAFRIKAREYVMNYARR